jgi:diacylglycerol kinase family enzyme
MRILLIHNPKAGDRKHSKKQLMAGLTRCGHQTLYHSIKERDWKKALKNPVDLVVAAGGDGTVRKTAWEIIGSGVPLAIFPLGTANNLARSLGFSAPVDEIIQSFHCGKTRPFDVGSVRSSSRTEYFLEAAGGGLFAITFLWQKPGGKGCFPGGTTHRAHAGGRVGCARTSSCNFSNRREHVARSDCWLFGCAA